MACFSAVKPSLWCVGSELELTPWAWGTLSIGHWHCALFLGCTAKVFGMHTVWRRFRARTYTLCLSPLSTVHCDMFFCSPAVVRCTVRARTCTLGLWPSVPCALATLCLCSLSLAPCGMFFCCSAVVGCRFRARTYTLCLGSFRPWALALCFVFLLPSRCFAEAHCVEVRRF